MAVGGTRDVSEHVENSVWVRGAADRGEDDAGISARRLAALGVPPAERRPGEDLLGARAVPERERGQPRRASPAGFSHRRADAPWVAEAPSARRAPLRRARRGWRRGR